MQAERFVHAGSPARDRHRTGEAAMQRDGRATIRGCECSGWSTGMELKLDRGPRSDRPSAAWTSGLGCARTPTARAGPAPRRGVGATSAERPRTPRGRRVVSGSRCRRRVRGRRRSLSQPREARRPSPLRSRWNIPRRGEKNLQARRRRRAVWGRCWARASRASVNSAPPTSSLVMTWRILGLESSRFARRCTGCRPWGSTGVLSVIILTPPSLHCALREARFARRRPATPGGRRTRG